jgi:hypothetical protein
MEGTLQVPRSGVLETPTSEIVTRGIFPPSVFNQMMCGAVHHNY